MIRKLSRFMLCFIVVGCASSSTKNYFPPPENILPPAFEVTSEKEREQLDYFYLKLAETNPERNSQWWIRYKRAQLWAKENPEIACEKFVALANDPLFPLNSLAFLRAHETCDEKDSGLATFSDLNLDKLPPWLKATAVEILLEKAKRTHNETSILEYSYEKSKFFLPVAEKVELTQAALEIAKKQKIEEKTALLTKRLYSLAPRLNPTPAPKDWLNVALDFRRDRQFDAARKYYSLVLNHKKSNLGAKLSALLGIRTSYKNERNKEAYVKATENYARFLYLKYKRYPKSPYYIEKLHDSYIELMRTYWTEGNITQAQNVLKFLERELSKKRSLAEVYWLRGRMLEERQNYKEAVVWFSKGLKEKSKDSEFREKLLWYQAWNLRKIKNYSQAQKDFSELKDHTTNEFAKARYQFWLAKTLEEDHQQAQAEIEYNNLIELDPLGYYGLLAHYQTHKKIPARPFKKKPIEIDKNLFSERKDLEEVIHLPTIQWLNSLEEFDIAKSYLNDVSSNYRKKKEQSEETWLSLFNFYAQSGYYLGLYEQLGNLTPERRNKILNDHPELLFPRPFYNQVKLASDRFGVSKELIYSIMRQESAFNPQARSPADAFGLMQMLPEVARERAKTLELEFSQAEDLFDPYTNINLGSSYLKELWDKNKGQFILVVSSYNASEKAIRGWLQTRFTGDTLQFIEDIPYEETRGYVRLVMRNLIFYQLMENEGQPIEFPEWVLKLDPMQI